MRSAGSFRQNPAGNIIEEELLDSIQTWLNWDFTRQSASCGPRIILRIAKRVVGIFKRFGARIELLSLYYILAFTAWLQQGRRNAPSADEMRKFPAFKEAYRLCGFRIHGEGHTHIPLQEDLYFEEPESRQNYTYVNFGTWRDQLVPKIKGRRNNWFKRLFRMEKTKGYRRRGVGRALVILDKAPENPGEPRPFGYWVEDIMNWSDKADKL